MKRRGRAYEKIEEVRLFVRNSCEGCSDNNSRHLNFHKTIVSHYFDARNVVINYEERKVKAEIAIGEGFTTLNFGCLDLSTFLSSCIKEDDKSLESYLNYIRMSTSTSRRTKMVI